MFFFKQILLIWTLAIGCQSVSKKEPAPTVANPIPLRINNDEGHQIPNFLWSPSRRKASAGFFYLVGEYKVLQGEVKDARQLFESAYNLDPNPFLGAKLIASEAASGSADQSLIEAKKMVLLYPNSAALHLLYGQLLAGKGAFNEAVPEFETSIEIDPLNEFAYIQLAEIHQFEKNSKESIKILQKMLKVLPNSEQGWSRLARAYLISDRKKDSLGPAQRAYDLQPNDPENMLIYALALDANGQSKKAVSVYENLFRLNPTNEQLVERMVAIYRSLGNLEESLELLTEAAAQTKEMKPGIQVQRAIILWELKRYEEAADTLTKLADKFPENDRLRYLAGLGEERIQKLENALKWYIEIPSNSDFYVFAKLRMASIYKQRKKFQQAIDILEELESDDRAGPDLYSVLASIHAEQENYRNAISVLNQGYQKFNEEHRFLFLRGVYEEKSGDIEATKKTMRRVTEVDPKNSAAFNFLGYIYAERGENLLEAERLITRALELKPDDGYYLDSLGWVYFQKGETKKALEFLQKASEKVPDEGVVYEHMGDVYLKLGDQAKALGFFKIALSKNLEEREKKRISGKVEQLAKIVEQKP